MSGFYGVCAIRSKFPNKWGHRVGCGESALLLLTTVRTPTFSLSYQSPRSKGVKGQKDKERYGSFRVAEANRAVAAVVRVRARLGKSFNSIPARPQLDSILPWPPSESRFLFALSLLFGLL